MERQLQNISEINILCKPSRVNSAPCIAYATFKMLAKNPEAKMAIAPSDHFILYEGSFIEKIELGLKEIDIYSILLTLGILQTKLHTGYGYIHFNKDGHNAIHKVNHFAENPILEKMKEFLFSKEYGMREYSSGK